MDLVKRTPSLGPCLILIFPRIHPIGVKVGPSMGGMNLIQLLMPYNQEHSGPFNTYITRMGWPTI